MRVYIVGGAVRDQLMNRTFKDKDFVVVGSTPEYMKNKGFIQVGDDFPVFLHPITKNEYALARTERKTGKGYKGFEVYATPEVTLEQDLMRRDLTINAMAIEVKSLMDDRPINGEVIDPYGGLDDLNDLVLRHVSSAFTEDPLRVLRIARFYGRFYNAELSKRFSIAPETLKLIADINASDELKHLTPERVWNETSRALMQSSPQAYFESLLTLGSLEHIMPEIALVLAMPSINALVLKALEISGQLNLNLQQRWTIVMLSFAGSNVNLLSTSNNLGSSDQTLDVTDWINASIKTSNDLKVPKKITQFVKSYIQCFQYLANYKSHTAESIASLIISTKADKDQTVINDILMVHKVIELAYQQLELTHFVDAYNSISIQDIDKSLEGSAIGDAFKLARIQSIAKIL